mgnify:CR=1 FL=1
MAAWPFFIIYSPLFTDGRKINFCTPKKGLIEI